MKRPLFWVGCCYLAVTAALILSRGRVLLCLGVVGLVLAASLLTRGSRPYCLGFLAAALAACAAFAANNALVLGPLEALAGRTLPFSGVVISREPRGSATLCRVYGTLGGDTRRLTLPVLSFDPVDAAPGEGVAGRVALLPPREGDRLRALAQGEILRGQGSLAPADTPEEDSPAGRTARLRARLLAVLDKAVPPGESGLVAGMVLSETSSLDKVTLGDMRRSGTAHLLVVSGYHVAVVSGAAVLLLGSLVGVGVRAASLGGAAAAWLMAALVGFTPSIVRAAVMMSFAMAARILSRRADPLTSLGVAALLVLVPNPYVLFSWSFLLSFSACLSILLFTPPIQAWLLSRFQARLRAPPKILAFAASAVAVTAGASVLSFPLQALLFGYLPLYSILANLLLSALAPVLIVAGGLAGILGLWGLWGPAVALGAAAGFCARLCRAISQFVAAMPGASLPVTGWWLAGLLLLAALLAVLCRAGGLGRRRVRWVALALIPALVAGTAIDLYQHVGSVRLVAWDDTGSFFLERAGAAAVVCDLPASSLDMEALADALERSGVSRLDLAVCQPLTPMKYSVLLLRQGAPLAAALPSGTREDVLPYLTGDPAIWPLEHTAITALGCAEFRYNPGANVLTLQIGDLKVLKLLAGYDIMMDKSLTRGVGLLVTPTGDFVALDPALRVRTDAAGRRYVFIKEAFP